MATSTTHKSGKGQSTTPDPTTDVTTPQRYLPHDHSFTLQAIMELQKAMGEVQESVKGLKSGIDGQTGKIEKIQDKLSTVTHTLYAAAAVVTIVVVVLGFAINKAADFWIRQATKPPVAAEQHSDTETNRK